MSGLLGLNVSFTFVDGKIVLNKGCLRSRCNPPLSSIAEPSPPTSHCDSPISTHCLPLSTQLCPHPALNSIALGPVPIKNLKRASHIVQSGNEDDKDQNLEDNDNPVEVE